MILGKFVNLQYEPAIYPNGAYEKNVKPLRKASAILVLEINGKNESFEIYKTLRKLAYYRCISQRFVELLNDVLKDKIFLLNDEKILDIDYFNEVVKEILRKIRVMKYHASR